MNKSDSPSSAYRQFKRKMTDMANAHNGQMTNDPRANYQFVMDTVESAEIVCAVWKDVREPDGVGIMIVKGKAVMERVAEGKQTINASAAAIGCNNVEQAISLADHVGDTYEFDLTKLSDEKLVRLVKHTRYRRH